MMDQAVVGGAEVEHAVGVVEVVEGKRVDVVDWFCRMIAVWVLADTFGAHFYVVADRFWWGVAAAFYW